MKETHLIRILKCGLYITAFVPLVIFKDFISPFHFGKIVVFRSLIEILFAFYIVLVWKNRSYLPKTNSIFWSLSAFTAVFGLTSIFSIQPYESFWGTLERMGGFLSFVHYFVFFIILISVFRTEKDWHRFLNVSIFVGLLSAFYGFGQKTDISFFVGSGNRARIFGTIGNAALFAGYELMIAFLSLMFWARSSSSVSQKLFYGFSFAIASIAVLMTAARGSILGLGLGLFVFAVLYVWAYESRAAKNIVVAFVLFSILFFLGSQIFKNTAFVENSRYLRRVTDLSLTSYTVQTRFWAWEAGLKAWDDSAKTIFLGWGPENFNIPFSKNFNPKFFQGPGSETLFDRAHNMFVEVLVTMGIIGLAAYASIFISLFRSLWVKIKKASKEQAIFFIGLFSLFISNVVHTAFFFDITANFILFFIVAGFAFFITTEVIKEKPNKESGNAKKLSNLQVLSLIAFLLMASWLIIVINIRPAKANYATTRAIVNGWSGNLKGAAEKFKEALGYNTLGVYEYRHRFAQFIFENSNKLDPSVISLGINEVSKNAESHPDDYLPLLYLSRLNILLGKNDPNSPYNDKAAEYALKALDISPTFVRTYYELGQAYINKRDLGKAAESFRKAAELNPDVGISYWYWGIIEADRGNVGLAASLIEKSFNTPIHFSPSESEYQRLLQFYFKINSYKGLTDILEKMISKYPDNPDYHAKLATVYSQTGRIEAAVEQAKIAAQLDPSFLQEAQSFIQSIGGKW